MRRRQDFNSPHLAAAVKIHAAAIAFQLTSPCGRCEDTCGDNSILSNPDRFIKDLQPSLLLKYGSKALKQIVEGLPPVLWTLNSEP